jgi:hypothetical protein
VLCTLLLVLFVIGLALLVGGHSTGVQRVLGASALAAAGLGFVQLFRWARGTSWTYDRPRAGVGASEAFLVCAACSLAFGLLLEPLGQWALLVFAATVVPIARLRYGLSLATSVALGVGLLIAIAALLGSLLGLG